MPTAVTGAHRTYAVIGTGALGGYYGAKLHHAGVEVHFLLRSDFEAVRRNGLEVRSDRDGDLSIEAPNVYRRAQELPHCDVVLVSLKTTSNHRLAELLPAAVGPDSCVLMMQNGLGAEAAAAACVPGATILGGLAFLCSNKIGPGRIHHLDYGAVRIAEYSVDGLPAGVTEHVESIGNDFRRANVRVHLEEDLVAARWLKLVWNVPYNGMCVAHGCTTDVLMNNPRLRAQCKEIMEEVARISAACGRPIDAGFVERMLKDTDDMVAYKPSMLLDFERKNPLELEAIYAAPLAAAREAGLTCPEIEALYERLCEIDESNRR